MKIGILGSGNVGTSLGAVWMRNGHDVVFGVRDVTADREDRIRDRAGDEAKIAVLKEAVAHGEVLILSTPWSAAQEVLSQHGPWEGKVLFDCTNPLGGLGLALGHHTSGAENVAEWASGAEVVKIFNTTGANVMSNPTQFEGEPTMFYCGDSDRAKSAAHELAVELGFDPIDAGALSEARYLEPLAMLWIRLAMVQGLGRGIAFRLMRT